MAKDKKGFVIYCDLIHTFEYLTDEQRGKIIFWVLEYTNDRNPEPLEGLLQAVVEPIKQQLKRDLKKFEERAERSRSNGRKGGRPRNLEEPEKTQQVISEPKKPDRDKVTVTDKVKVIDTVTVKEKDNITLDSRKADFGKSLHPYLKEYSKEMLTDFFEYWTEHGLKDKKMRFEKEKSFSISRRIKTWKRNENKFSNENRNNNNGAKSKGYSKDEINEGFDKFFGVRR